jgi:hypothetical protein
VKKAIFLIRDPLLYPSELQPLAILNHLFNKLTEVEVKEKFLLTFKIQAFIKRPVTRNSSLQTGRRTAARVLAFSFQKNLLIPRIENRSKV